MSSRRLPALLLALLLLPVVAPSLPTSEAQGSGAAAPSGPVTCPVREVRYLSCIDPLHRTQTAMAGLAHNLYAVGWRPVPNPFSGLHEALVVGGMPPQCRLPGGNIECRSLVLLYDGVTLTKLYDKPGPAFLDIDWAPDGSYALIVSDARPILHVTPPRAGDPSYHFTDLWSDCEAVAIENCEEASFYGHQVAFNPTQGFAWITGSSLLQFDGRELTVIEEGADIAYRAIGWDPSGQRGFLSAVVCVDPTNPMVDVGCPEDALSLNQTVSGRILYADVAAQRLCEVHTYGKYDPQRAEVNGITWSPRGDYALIYGDDSFHGTVLRFDATVPATGTASNGCPQFGESFRYLPQEKAEGEFNDVTFHPRTGRAYLSASAGKEVWETNGTALFDVFGETDINPGEKGTLYYGIQWDPSHRYLLISGFQGVLYKFVPANMPFLRITTPRNDTLVTGDVMVAGKGFATSVFAPVERVEVNIQAPDGTATGWRDAPIVSSFKGIANWSLPWDTSALPEGFYTLQARGYQGLNVSNWHNRTVHVVRPITLGAPVLEPLESPDGDGAYAVRWSAVEGEGVRYELEEAGLPAGFSAIQGEAAAGYAFAGDERLLYEGGATAFDVGERKDGVYVYRVRTRTDLGISPWSAPVSVSVAIDSDGDGSPDAEEVARGANPNDAGSNLDDLDGDGHKNADDAFPYDATEWKDTDGDGIGDNADKFPTDPREWLDSDFDRWGDNAEKRLGSDAVDARSTPESDDDGDGCLNKDEAGARSNPKDPASGPAWCLKAKAGVAGGPEARTPAPGAALLVLALVGGALLAARRRGGRA